jgi:7,8-dihydropterin-6-yl-methyl-4-(beta-D-ribofuranosyl)aminobenzene 5'-phosphate synthase
MLKALDLIRARDGDLTIPCYVHPEMFRSRGRRLPNGRMLASKDVPSVDTLNAHSASVANTTEPQVFLDGMFYLTGEIPRVTAFERGFPGHCRKTKDGNGWEPDVWIMDERFLAVNIAGKVWPY